MKKKILIVIPYFIPAYSYWWPIKVAYDQAKELLKRGYEVTVVTTDALDAKNRIKKFEEHIDGIKIIRFRNVSNYLAKYHNFYMPIWFRKRIRNNIKDFDIVHMHDFFTYLNILTANYCRKYDIKYYIQPHGSANFIPERGKAFIKKIFFALFGNVLLKYSHGIIAVSESEKKAIHYTANKEKITVVYNGIDFSELDQSVKHISDTQMNEFLWKYHIKDKKIILSLGRLSFVKRFDKLIHFANFFLKNNKEYVLLIAWPDEWEKEKLQDIITKEWLEDSIILTWWLYWNDKYIAYKVSNLFCLLSDSEAWSITIIEAIYFDLPMLLSPWCHFEFVYDNITIVDNQSQFEKWLQKLLSHKSVYDEDFKQKFTIPYLIDKLEQVYDNKR